MSAGETPAATASVSATADAPRARWRALGWRGPALAAMGLCAAVAYRGLVGLGAGETGSQLPDAEAFLFEPSANSPGLVFAALAWMLARRAGRLRATLGAPPQRLLGALALAGGLVLALWSYGVAVPAFLLPSLTLTMIGAALWLGGKAALRVIWIPAVFVLFAYPLPPPLVNAVIYPLQLAVTAATAWLLNLVGIAAVIEGDRIVVGRSVFQVIESCSGLRGTLTILMSAVLYVELFHQSRLRSALIVAAAPVIGLVTNELRVLTIVLNPYSYIAAVHMAQGLAMIVVAVLLLAVWDALLGRLLPAPEPRPRVRLPRREAPGAALAPLGALALALLVASFAIEPWPQPSAAARPLASLLLEIDGQPPRGLKLDKQFMGSTHFSEWVHRGFGEGPEAVEVFLGADDRSTGAVRLHSPKTGVLESGWTVVDQGRTRLASGAEADWLLLRSGSERKLAWRWYRGLASGAEELARGLLAMDRSPLRRDGRAVVVRVATPVGDGSTAPSAAQERLARVAARVERELDAALPAQSTSAKPFFVFMNAR